MSIYYKYRSFDADNLWESIFNGHEFWFSAAKNLNDSDEVFIDLEPPYVEQKAELNKLRNSTTILSLGRTSDNQHLWQRYGDEKRGFCIEADFSQLTPCKGFHFAEVVYTDGVAVPTLNRDKVHESINDFERVCEEIWKKLFITKQSCKWAIENEVRYLHYCEGADDRCNGFSKSLDPTALKKVFIYPSCISKTNRTNLELLINNYSSKFSHKIETVLVN